MQPPPTLNDEPERLERLTRLDIMDTNAEPVLDRLTHLAASIAGAPIALISLVDHYRQWWKSAVGHLPQGGETCREISFCAHAIAQDDLFEIEDARLDERFADNPLVVGPPHMIHYAGMPLRMPKGERLGTICVIDHQPGKLSEAATQVLRQLAGLVVDILLMREQDRLAAATRASEAVLRTSEKRLQTIADVMPQMLWSATPDGLADYYNARWYQFTGVPAGSARGDDWNNLVHPDDRTQVLAHWKHCVTTNEPYEVECRLLHASGEYRWILGRAMPVRDEQGRTIRWIGTCTEVHEQHIAQDKLKDVDRQKDDFLAMLAHELRNPLAPITSGAQVLSKSNDPAAQRIGIIIARQARQMKALVDDLLDVSRVTRGLVDLHRESLDLREVVHDAMEQAWPLLEAKEHEVLLHLGDAVSPTLADRTRMTQVVANLVNNAAKYTPKRGRIEITLGSETDTVRVEVKDNGQGIDAGLLPHVFDLFTQADRTGDRTTGGLGLGLALVRSLVELHGGTVAVHSEGRGRGATFTVSLPLSDVISVRQRPAREKPLKSRRPLDILIVDDNADAAASMAAWLQAQGHTVRVETCSLRAITAIEQRCPQIFILDIGLPFMNGYELALQIRHDLSCEGARLIAVSGYTSAEDKERALQAGFDYHLSKPADLADLSRAITGTD